MKVAQITPYSFPHIGGIEIHVENLSKALSKFYDVEIISSSTIPSLPIPYSPIPLKKRKCNAEIYHAHVPSPFFAYIYSSEDKFVVTYHNDVEVPDEVLGISIPRFAAKKIEEINEKVTRKVLDRAEVIVATTSDYARTSKILRDYEEKLEFIPNGVRVEDFDFYSEKENFVLYVGRLVKYKGLDCLIEALENSEERLVVAGDGEDRKYFEKMAEEKSVNAKFLGKVEYEKVKELMRKAKCLVLPSKTRLEAFGIVLLEAMASGTPVIAYNTPGVREIAKKAGYTFESVEELREKIKKLDSKTVRKLGRRGRKVAESYSWEKVAEKISKIYESL